MQENEKFDLDQNKCADKRCFYTWIHLTLTSILALILVYFGLHFFIPKTSNMNKIYINQTLAVPIGAPIVNNEVDTVLIIYEPLVNYDSLNLGDKVVIKIKLAQEYVSWVYEYNGEDGDNILVVNERTGWIEPHSKENVIGKFQKNSNFFHKMYYMATLWFGYILLILFFLSIYTLSRFYILKPLEDKIKNNQTKKDIK